MRDYLASLIFVSVIVAIAELISPHIAGLQKYIKMIGALCILCVAIAPILNISDTSRDFTQDLKEELSDIEGSESYNKYQDILYGYLNEYSSYKVKEEISLIIEEKFNIPKNECEIVLITESRDGGIALAKVQILLSGKSIFNNPYKIEDYVSALLSCPCEVLIE